MKKLGLSLIILLMYPAFASNIWTTSSSFVSFKIKNAGITVDGNLKGYKGTYTFDTANLAQAKIIASVDVGTISTGIKDRDAHLKKEEYFNAATYPKIQMESTKFERVKTNTFKGFFNVTIKGKTKLIQVPFTFKSESDAKVFRGTFSLNRLDFGVGKSSILLSNTVQVNLIIKVK